MEMLKAEVAKRVARNATSFNDYVTGTSCQILHAATKGETYLIRSIGSKEAYLELKRWLLESGYKVDDYEIPNSRFASGEQFKISWD